jgi:hypothetical protein
VLQLLAQVFDSVCELVQSALDGYHVCLFSYGQTGAGKTFTMTGGPTPEQQGIMPRAVQQVRGCCQIALLWLLSRCVVLSCLTPSQPQPPA